jgi:hypothetical protein
MEIVIGIILIVAAIALAAKIIINRGPILPHVIGPIFLAIIGVILVILSLK